MKMTKELSQAPIILGRPFLATAKAVTDWGERRSNSQGGRAHREGRHQQNHEIPFTSFRRLGRHRLHRWSRHRCMRRRSDDDRRGSKIWGASNGRANFGAQNSPVYTQVCLADEEKAKPVIILSKLDMKKEEQLFEVLRKKKEAIGWTLTDLKGLDPSLCTHRIFLEDESRPVREAQRWLNPRVWEVVKEEILKWLNVEIIYPISDSQWVSPVHVVPKKARVMVTRNEKGEEIQTRLPTKLRVCIDYSLVRLAPSPSDACHSDCATPPRPFNDA